MTTTIHPTAPGCVEGIISLNPIRVQCQECGITRDAESLGYAKAPETPESTQTRNAVLLFGGINFCHASPLRRCEACRKAAADCPKCCQLD